MSDSLFPTPEPIPPLSVVEDLSGCCLGYEGEDGTIMDARHHTEQQARERIAGEWGMDVKDISVTPRYGRWLTEQEMWEGQGRDRWMSQQVSAWQDEDHPSGIEWWDEKVARAALAERGITEAPADMPEGWAPDYEDECLNVWRFTDVNDPLGVLVYVCSGGA